jgi:hypothetical protein
VKEMMEYINIKTIYMMVQEMVLFSNGMDLERKDFIGF